MPEKIKIALAQGATCSGCDIAVLDLDVELLKLFEVADLAFAPLVTVLRLEGDRAALRLWIERLLKWLALGSVTVVLAAVLVGKDVVPLVLGSAYRPVAANLVPLAIGLVALSLTSVANLSALTHDRPGVALAAAVLRLGTFWVLGLSLAGRWGSWGASLAVLGALAVQAGFFLPARSL